MVVGLEMLRTYLAGYDRHYTIIGGTGCEIRLEGQGIPFRATKDIDILLILESLDKDFLGQFWKMIRDGGYEDRAYASSERKFFRFQKPRTFGFPQIIELFSKKPELFSLPEGFHLTPIPTDEEISSLSALLLQDDYYDFTIEQSSMVNGLTIAREPALLCLKVKAFLNNQKRKEQGQSVKTVDIEKHKKDIIKLAGTLTGTYQISPDMKDDLRSFVEILSLQQPNIADIAKDLGITNVKLDQLIEVINQSFQLKL
jgi:hypothetical protein